ncbi:ligase-associated DNA damage response endonuclease PdeM [Altibacter sp.]|uniref:ligase-associated DNA damage response endonuclease PdeM n=1 Tax=Altibacter sp. TaxID=2024823 RepID=UPI000C94CC3F|nr:ligase-associated DNA damage response endonuclease PdeM [Altibacter sp.]MAP55812.1 metallophosphoesterase [Altibacter sp.]
MTASLFIHDQEFKLHASGAAYWVQQSMLLIADVHFGKVTHFRKYGAAVPLKASEENFQKLRDITEAFNPATICFLGDLFHSKKNNEWKNFEAWARDTSTTVILVSGNHDVIPPYLYEALGLTVVDALHIDSFLLTHHPTEHETLFNICGHIHPGIRLQGGGRQSVRLACFYKREGQFILPAFGTFTGKHIMNPQQEDIIFAIAEGQVVCVSNNP